MNKQDGLCFGLVNGFELELGYFSLEKLLTETDTLGCQSRKMSTGHRCDCVSYRGNYDYNGRESANLIRPKA
jgi:hypothetical protein